MINTTLQDDEACATIMWVPMKGKSIKKNKLPKRLAQRLAQGKQEKKPKGTGASLEAGGVTSAATAAITPAATAGIAASASQREEPSSSLEKMAGNTGGASIEAEVTGSDLTGMGEGADDLDDLDVREPFRWKSSLLGLFGIYGGELSLPARACLLCYDTEHRHTKNLALFTLVGAAAISCSGNSCFPTF